MTDGSASGDRSADAFLLRLLYGPQAGAEITLLPGRYLIGTDEDCDLVLSDGQMAPKHASFVLTPGQMSIEPLDGKVIVGVGRVFDTKSLANFEPVLLGSTVIALGPPDVAWPPIDPPGPEPEAVDEVNADEDLPPDTGDPAGPLSLAADKPTEPASASSAPTASTGRSWARVLSHGLMLLGIVTLISGIGYRLFDAPTQNAPSPGPAKTPRDEVVAIVKQLDFASKLTVVRPAAEERLTVTGYVTTDHQRRELLAALRPVRNSVDVRVWPTDLLRESVMQAVAGLRLPLVVNSVDDGDVELAGVLPESTSEDALKKALMRDVPGIRSLDLKTVSVAAAAAWLREQIQATSIPDEALKVMANGANLTIEGQLDSSERGVWQEVADGFNQRFGGQISLDDQVSQVRTATNTGATFDLVVRAINTGPPAWIKLDTNEKYLIGGRLPNGMVLDRVVPTGMVLDDEGTKHLVEIAKDSGEVERVRRLDTE